MRRIRKIFGHVCGRQTTPPHTFKDKTRLYTQHFAANRMSGRTRVYAPERLKAGKVGYFCHFFGFSSIRAELFIFEENFCRLKFRSHRDPPFPLIGRSLQSFLA